MAKKATVILPDILEALGLKLLLQENFSVQVNTAATLNDVEQHECEKSDLLVTCESEFLANMSVLIPFKEKIVLLTDKDIAGFQCILRTMQPAEMVVKLNYLFKDKNDDTQANRLSPREISVLQLVVEGCINKEIADRLNISINTVLTHRKNITTKLGIKSVSGLSVYALMNGLIK